MHRLTAPTTIIARAIPLQAENRKIRKFGEGADANVAHKLATTLGIDRTVADGFQVAGISHLEATAICEPQVSLADGSSTVRATNRQLAVDTQVPPVDSQTCDARRLLTTHNDGSFSRAE